MITLCSACKCMMTLVPCPNVGMVFFLAIYTAAMAMLGGGEAVKSQCRTPEIMADAAYSILTKDSRSFTGNFCIDDLVLKQDGITDLSQYNYVESMWTSF